MRKFVYWFFDKRASPGRAAGEYSACLFDGVYVWMKLVGG